MKRNIFRGMIYAMLLLGVTTACAAGEKNLGRVNAALNKEVSATTTYNAPEGWYQPQFLTDGKVEAVGGGKHLGWSSDPNDKGIKDDTQILLQINLGGEYEIDEVRIKKCDDDTFFPKTIEVLVSNDAINYTSLAVSKESDNTDYGMLIKFAAVKAEYVRCVILRSSGRNDWGAYLSQIGEIEVYGVFTGEIVNKINKQALRMNPGSTDKLSVGNIKGNVSVNWRSDDESIVTIDADGNVKAIALGQTIIRGTDADGKECTCNVLVDNYRIQEKFMITTFRSPSKANLNERSYDLLKQAGITNVQNEWNTGTNSVEDNMLMCQLAYERGMDVTVAETNWRDGFVGLTEKQIRERIEKYTHVPGVGGFYILDEPGNPNPFAHAFPTIHKLMPTADIHLNMLPLYCYESYEVYQAQANDWVQSCKPENLGYLIYDFYPFTTADTKFLESMLITNLNAIREVGLKTGVKTGCFIQSIGRYVSKDSTEILGLRIPTGGDVRLQVNYSIAYGMKQLGYFCWETPVYDAGTEAFSPAIVDRYGEPTPLFYDVCDINRAVNVLGPTLMKLDAIDVYTAGRKYKDTKAVPKDFFVQPEEGSQAIVSYMRDKKNGCNYCMIVNRDNVNNYTMSFTVNDSITSIEEVSQQDGLVHTFAKGEDGKYTITLIPGEGRLFKMPDSYDYTPEFGKRKTSEGENLALECEVGGSYSLGTDGKYFSFLTDGKTSSYSGWQSSDNFSDYIDIDLADTLDINKVNIAPMGNKLSGIKKISVYISNDNEQWSKVGEKNTSSDNTGTCTLDFDDTHARYVRIEVTHSGVIKLSEIEVYGKGTIPKTPEPDPTKDKATPEKQENSTDRVKRTTSPWLFASIVGIIAACGLLLFAVIKKSDKK